ncbi:hypothetical protein BD626DRAFT_487349 [Schizophyllum amplum]|uniref:Uncharacterized protein n=1 Tax=Schizophyllum amplum TaxID=97359 RepID=A0A550CNA5_9AGAR|nr:hypothetical protein BD626DRAFT_487349 [Auriculariopsis ampla]
MFLTCDQGYIAPVNENPVFFIGFFSKKQTQFTLVRPPQAVDKFLGRRLKERLEKGAIASDQEQNETLRIIELNRNSLLFMMHVLSALNEIFYNLDATIPLRDDRLHHPNHKKEILTAANSAAMHAQQQDAFTMPAPRERTHRQRSR